MGLEAIEKDILEISKELAEERIAEARQKADDIKNTTLLEIKNDDNNSEQETHRIIEETRRNLLASAKFEIKKIELSAKKEVLEKVFEKTKEKILSLDAKTLEALSNVLLEDAKKEIDIAKVYCNQKTKKFIPKGLDVETVDMLGGIIAENSEGTIRVDNSFETILEEVRKDALKKIAKNVI